jgi:hypothetical protein
MKARACPARDGGSGASTGNTVAANKRPIPIANGIGLYERNENRCEDKKKRKLYRGAQSFVGEWSCIRLINPDPIVIRTNRKFNFR